MPCRDGLGFRCRDGCARDMLLGGEESCFPHCCQRVVPGEVVLHATVAAIEDQDGSLLTCGQPRDVARRLDDVAKEIVRDENMWIGLVYPYLVPSVTVGQACGDELAGDSRGELPCLLGVFSTGDLNPHHAGTTVMVSVSPTRSALTFTTSNWRDAWMAFTM